MNLALAARREILFASFREFRSFFLVFFGAGRKALPGPETVKLKSRFGSVPFCSFCVLEKALKISRLPNLS